jgi:hypothetical protein
MFTRQDHGPGEAAPGLPGYLTGTPSRAAQPTTPGAPPGTLRSLLTNIDHGSGPPLRSELANIRSHFLRTKSAVKEQAR